MAEAEQNKRAVIDFYEEVFNARRPAEAVAEYVGPEYVGPEYVQHDPPIPDGPEAFVEFAGGFIGRFPELSLEIRCAVAEGDLVVMHSLVKTSPEDRGTAVVDILRLDEGGKVVEHWDVLQPVPEDSANGRPMV